MGPNRNSRDDSTRNSKSIPRFLSPSMKFLVYRAIPVASSPRKSCAIKVKGRGSESLPGLEMKRELDHRAVEVPLHPREQPRERQPDVPFDVVVVLLLDADHIEPRLRVVGLVILPKIVKRLLGEESYVGRVHEGIAMFVMRDEEGDERTRPCNPVDLFHRPDRVRKVF